MARRTKEDALATRHKLLDAAEQLFQLQGVSRTSLQDIARRAGATRGAVYWHFKDKADLFNQMMERVTLPLEELFAPKTALAEGQTHAQAMTGLTPLAELRTATCHALHQIAHDARTRCVIEVATHKVEYVDELQAVRQRHLGVRKVFLKRFAQSLDAEAVKQKMVLRMPAEVAAKGFYALTDGLIQNWLLDQTAFDLVEIGRMTIDVYLLGLGIQFAPCSNGTLSEQGAEPSKKITKS